MTWSRIWGEFHKGEAGEGSRRHKARGTSVREREDEVGGSSRPGFRDVSLPVI